MQILRIILSTCLGLLIFVNNIQAQKAPKNEFTFAILGDSQFNKTDVFNRIVNEVALLSPSLVVQVGDLITGKLKARDTTMKQWARFKEQIKPLRNIPYYPVPGNHDVLDKKGNPLPYYKEYWGKMYYSFNYKNAHFTILNTNDGKEAQIDEAQVAWLEKDLTTAPFCVFSPSHLSPQKL